MMNNRVLFLGLLICSTAVCAWPASSANAGGGGSGAGASQTAVGEEPSDVGGTPSGAPGSVGGADSLSPTDAKDPSRRSVLEEVPALDRPVSYTETKIPLGDLVKKVAGETGVPLTAAREVADEPVAVVVKAMPARELLEQLAALLDYQWDRQGRAERTRYEIGQDLASKQREEGLRQAVFAEGEERFRQELGRYMEAAALSQAQIQQIVDAEERHQQELARLTPEQRQALDSRPEERERRQRFRAARGLFSPVSRGLVALLRYLSPQQWAILREAGRMTLSTEPRPGELRLPEEVDRFFRAAQPCSYLLGAPGIAHDPGVEEWLRQRERTMQEQWAAATGYPVTIRLAADRLSIGGSFSLKAEATPIGSAAPSPFLLMGDSPGTGLFLGGDPEDLQQPVAADWPPRHAELENDPVLGTRKSFRLAAKGHASPLKVENGSELRVQGLLPDLARTYGVQFIADAYWNSPSFSESEVATGEPLPLWALLDRLAGKAYLWDRVSTNGAPGSGPPAGYPPQAGGVSPAHAADGGNLIRLRSRQWFFDRPKEVPVRIVRQLRELSDRHGALPLEAYLEIATSLNDGPLSTLGDLVNEGVLPYELQDLSTVYSARSVLRLYASLASIQRQALWQGKAIRAAQMTPAQRDLLVAALQENSLSGPPPLELTSLAAGSLSLTAERCVQIREQREGSTRYYTEPARGPAEPLAANDTPVTTPASGRVPAAGGWADGLRGTNVSLSRRVTPTIERAGVIRHPVTQVRLQFQYGSVANELACLTIASPL